MEKSMINHDVKSEKQTFVEEGTVFKGTLTSTCPVAVRGTLDGDIKTPMLTITETGTVVGNVEAKSIRSEGVLAGNITADDIFLSGKVRDNTVIRAKTLEVKLTQEKSKLEVTFGECKLEVGENPANVMNGQDQKDDSPKAGRFASIRANDDLKKEGDGHDKNDDLKKEGDGHDKGKEKAA
jgi:cytoskeletal protein CcmA (bactofilin family)